MKGKHVSPGSYSSEFNRSQRIEQTSGTIMAMVMPSSRGPVMQRTRITSREEFKALFGKGEPRLGPQKNAALEIAKTKGQLYVTRVVQTDPAKNRPLTAGAFCTVDDLQAAHPTVSLRPFDDGSSKPKGLYDPHNTLGFVPGSPGVNQVLFAVYAENPGEWNNDLYVRIRPSLPAGVSEFDANVDPTVFWLDVFEGYRSPRQTPTESYLVCRERKVDGNGNQLFIEDVINTKSARIRVRNNELCPQVKVLHAFDCYFGGGTNGDPVTVARMIEGWQLYNNPEDVDVNLLVQAGAPSHFSLLDIADLQHAMLDLCEERGDCSPILDMPRQVEDNLALSIAYRVDTLNRSSDYGAMFTPHCEIKDADNDQYVYVPASAFVASACVNTDRDYALWFAAAGMVRGSLPTVRNARIYNQTERDALDSNQINCIRYFADGSGYKIWGASTLQVEKTATNYWPVRRLLCHIEKAISIANLYRAFDPNDEILWHALDEMCTRFLRPIQDGRGLYWFEVVCNETNNTPAVIAAGDTIVDVYLDPVLFAKRIHLNAILVKTGTTSFKEAAQQLGRNT